MATARNPPRKSTGAGESARAPAAPKPSAAMVLRAADDLIRETQGVPPRIREHLDTLKVGLKKLVDEKVPVKTIGDKFVRKFPWKISQTHLREYLRDEFDYPAATKRTASKKPKKKVAKKSSSKR